MGRRLRGFSFVGLQGRLRHQGLRGTQGLLRPLALLGVVGLLGLGTTVGSGGASTPTMRAFLPLRPRHLAPPPPTPYLS